MNNLITIENNEIRLTSNLDEYSFGKTNYNSILSQEGYLFDGKNFKIWTFDEVKSFEVEGKTERIVFYCGKNPLSKNAKTLAEQFEKNDETLFKAVELLCKAFTQAAEYNTDISQIGSGGILVDMSLPTPAALFLPEDLFKTSANALSKEEYIELQGGWINETLSGLPGICFERATLVYKLLTGRLPYASTNPVERNADILDRKFLPLELCVEGINSTLAKEVNKGLKLNSNAVNIPGKRQKGKSSEELTPTSEFPQELLEEAWKLSKKQSAESNKDFEDKVNNYIKLRDSKISTKRNIRRNISLIVSIFAIIIVIIITTINTVKSNLDEYCPRGLTSVQTIQGFFQGVNAKDTVMLDNFIKGKQPSSYVDAVSRIFVLHKQRMSYGNDNGFATPENWLIYSTNYQRYQNSGIYGITNLVIDGKPYEPDVQMFKKNENIPPLEKEGNITLTDKSESVHKVEYYLLHTGEEEEEFTVEKETDIITLTFVKDQWRITNIDVTQEHLPVDCVAFRTEYFELLNKNEDDPVITVKQLKNKYQWLPTNAAMQKEWDAIIYSLQHPYSMLGIE